MLEIIQVVIISVVALSLGVVLVKAATTKNQRQDWVRVVRGIRWWMLPGAMVTLTITITTAVLLYQVPGLSWGWWSAVGGEGNVLLGQTSGPITSGPGQAGAPSALSTVLGALGVVIPVALLAGAPLLALSEEYQFRYRTAEDSPAKVLWTAVKFGLIHLIVGIPISAGLALTIGGLTYYWVYRKARNRHLHGLANSRRERSLSLLPISLASDEKLAESLVRLQAVSDEIEAETHGTFVAASFHTVWNALLISLLLLALAVLAWT